LPAIIGFEVPALIALIKLASLPYLASMAALIASAAWYFWKKPVLNQLFAIVLIMVITPPVSFDYTLMSLWLPCGALLIALIRGEVRRAALFLIPLAILFTPQSYIRVGLIPYGGQLKALLALFLLAAAARFPLPSSLFDDDMAKAKPLAAASK